MADFSPFDFGATFANVSNALPDYATEAVNARNARTQQGQLALLREKEDREVAEEESALADWQELEANPTNAGWVGFVMRHPKWVDQAKAAKGYIDKETDKADRTLKGRVFNAARNGEWAMAADVMEERIKADEAAGVDTRDDRLMLQLLRHPDQAQRNKGLAMIGFDLAMDDVNQFAATYGITNPDPEDLEWHDGVWWNKKTGQPVSQDPRGHTIPTPQGTANIGRIDNVNLGGVVNEAGQPVAPSGYPAIPPGGPSTVPALYTSPLAGPGGIAPGPMLPNGVIDYRTPGIAAQPGDMDVSPIPGILPTPNQILDARGGNVPDPLAPEPGPAAMAPQLPSLGPAAAPPSPAGHRPPPKLAQLALNTDVRNFLVNNAKSAVQSIFPSARVTEWKRNPNSRLGRANPKSWHNHSRAAVDVAPIPGLTFGGFVDRIKAEGYKIVESRDEVKNPSKHATGPHWHTVLQLWPGRSKQEYDKIPSGGRYLDPNGVERRKG